MPRLRLICEPVRSTNHETIISRPAARVWGVEDGVDWEEPAVLAGGVGGGGGGGELEDDGGDGGFGAGGWADDRWWWVWWVSCMWWWCRVDGSAATSGGGGARVMWPDGMQQGLLALMLVYSSFRAVDQALDVCPRLLGA